MLFKFMMALMLSTLTLSKTFLLSLSLFSLPCPVFFTSPLSSRLSLHFSALSLAIHPPLSCPVSRRYIGNVARFFNHSCHPNLRPVKVMCYREGKSYLTMAFFALRRIEPGEELTWKYVSGITRKSGQRCYCGSSNCAGFI
jgi:hypothetical protein